MRCALGVELLAQIGEVFDVAALIGRQRHTLDVLADRGGHDIGDAAVVAEVDDLRALGLQQPTHDIDGRVVPVEQAGCGDEAHRMGGNVEGLVHE